MSLFNSEPATSALTHCIETIFFLFSSTVHRIAQRCRTPPRVLIVKFVKLSCALSARGHLTDFSIRFIGGFRQLYLHLHFRR